MKLLLVAIEAEVMPAELSRLIEGVVGGAVGGPVGGAVAGVTETKQTFPTPAAAGAPIRADRQQPKAAAEPTRRRVLIQRPPEPAPDHSPVRELPPTRSGPGGRPGRKSTILVSIDGGPPCTIVEAAGELGCSTSAVSLALRKGRACKGHQLARAKVTTVAIAADPHEARPRGTADPLPLRPAAAAPDPAPIVARRGWKRRAP
jgi:hypothetical protein